MRKIIPYFLLFLAIIVATVFVKRKTYKAEEKASTVEVIEVELPSGFVDFYNKFHSDSIYQLTHITFPLQGLPAMIDSTIDTNNYRWMKKNWVLHKAFDNHNGTFIRDFSNFNDIITERIYDNGHRFEMRRRFSQIGKEWFLIYYVAMNPSEIFQQNQ